MWPVDRGNTMISTSYAQKSPHTLRSDNKYYMALNTIFSVVVISRAITATQRKLNTLKPCRVPFESTIGWYFPTI